MNVKYLATANTTIKSKLETEQNKSLELSKQYSLLQYKASQATCQ